MKEQFINLLKEAGTLPIGGPAWNSFDIVHSQTECQDLKHVREYITSYTKKSNGIYVYKNELDHVLYIGKGKPIKDRLYSHFIETYKQVSGDRSGKWHRFFNHHHGNMRVYWIELEDEGIRKFVEHLLTEEYKPNFITFKR